MAVMFVPARAQRDRCRKSWLYRSGERLAEAGGEIDEITDRDGVVVIQVAVAPGGVALAEVSGEINEVGDGNEVVEV